MSDVEIGEVTTRIEITDRPPEATRDMRKLVELVMEHLRQERLHETMRDDDGRIRDRSWISDVKPE
jgi:hypothetical protein